MSTPHDTLTEAVGRLEEDLDETSGIYCCVLAKDLRAVLAALKPNPDAALSAQSPQADAGREEKK